MVPFGSSDRDEYGLANKRYNLYVNSTCEKISAKQYHRSTRYSTPNLLVRSTGTDPSFVDSERRSHESYRSTTLPVDRSHPRTCPPHDPAVWYDRHLANRRFHRPANPAKHLNGHGQLS
jgi:hypothetical protein